MAGRGFLNEAAEIDTKNILVLRNGRWVRMFRPVNPDRSFSGVCLAESFAEAYAAKYGVEVGLIPCADGGTSLDQWKEGSLLYDNAVYQARLASRTSTIAGVLWHQGEADCPPFLHTTYRARFELMMAAMRRDLDLDDVPFLLGGLGDFLVNCPLDAKLLHSPRINEALREIADNNDLVSFVSAEGLTSNPDLLHFSASALHEFGLRYFEAYEKVRDPNKIFSNKPSVNDAQRTAMELL